MQIYTSSSEFLYSRKIEVITFFQLRKKDRSGACIVQAKSSAGNATVSQLKQGKITAGQIRAGNMTTGQVSGGQVKGGNITGATITGADLTGAGVKAASINGAKVVAGANQTKPAY